MWESWENCTGKYFSKLLIQEVAECFQHLGGFFVSEEREYWLLQSISQECTLLTETPNTVIAFSSRKGWKGVGDTHLPFSALERVEQWTRYVEPNSTRTKKPVAGMRNTINNLGLSQQNDEESKCYYVVWTPFGEVGKLNMESWVSLLGKIRKLKLKLRQRKKSTLEISYLMEIPGMCVQVAAKVLLKETPHHCSVLPSDTQDNFSDWEDGLPLSCLSDGLIPSPALLYLSDNTEILLKGCSVFD